MEETPKPSPSSPSWQSCIHCPKLFFTASSDFERHIQEKHSIKEGSIILCQYGQNGLCSALQFGDLSRAGYRCHVRQHHVSSSSTSSSNWDFYSSSQNLPAVLNDPNRGKQSNFFTKTWGDSFVEKTDILPSPYLPEITLAHFESYCKKISKRFRRHTRLKENAIAKQLQPSVDNIPDEIPEIFYQQSLRLNDPDVFKKVFPNLSNGENGTCTAAAIRTLQESLSTYLDIIEIKISKQVAEKSDAFFHAMLSHDAIMEQMASAIKLVKETRQEMTEIKINLTGSPLKLVGLTNCQKNMNDVYEKLKLMSTVQQTQPMIQLLLSTSDYMAALDLISSTQRVLSTQLTGIHAFRHLSQQLTEMQRLINKILNSEFHKFVETDLNRPPADETELPERDKLTSIVSGILRLKELDFIDTFKSEAMTTIQATVKQIVIEIISERDSHSEIVLRGSSAENTSLLTTEAIAFMNRASPSLLIVLKRITTIINLIQEISQMDEVTAQNEEFLTKEEMLQLNEKLNKMLVSVTDYCNERCANLIVTKMEKDHMATDLTHLSRLSGLIEHFTMECEAVTGHCSNTMKLALKSFAMKFMQNLHSERRVQLTNSLNAEKWKPADVPYQLQATIDDICKTGEISPRLQQTQRLQPDLKYLNINNEAYTVVATVQLLIRIILEYCDATKKSPAVVQYVVHCLLELLRHFNSRCCQLVLGAGALQSAGLKTITTSNLAIVSRSLQVVLWILPVVKHHLEQLTTGDVSVNGFDTVESDIKSHKQEIENKIFSIVSTLLSSQLIGWEARPPVPSQTFRSISKHLVKLHEALSNILPMYEIRSIYRRVHDNFKDKLREQLVKMSIVRNGGPQHGVVTSELTFYLQTLKTLQITTEDDLEENILYDVWAS